MAIPRRIGPYRIVAPLGHGGMAEVFKAIAVGASGFEKLVALKVLRAEHRGDAELERMLIEEAKLGAKLAHRNLLQVHDLGVDDGVYYVRMDYVHGADLDTLRGREAPSRDLALLVAEEVAQALAYVHSLTDDDGRPLGLVHRDVSPSNVLVSRDGEVKLADFGIAKATRLASNTAAAIRRGKYAYMSPEQISGAPLSSRSDQFGFGVMLHELLLGTRPFDGPTPLETMDRIREATPPELTGLEADLSAIVSTCLEKNPDERFETAEALQRALAAARRLRDAVGSADLGRWVRANLDGPQVTPRARTATLPIGED
ncbi:MAG: serine/threonine protein kinase [Sandaracinaceae bacterium]|nr:serine/threonine protein kinase [Sandaracinaceae bacterium]